MSNGIKYQGARFYKCALQVNPFTYGQRYRGEKGQAEQQYNQELLQQCQDNGIEVVGLADHGRVKKSESLRVLLRGNGITVFPGFEIASSEKIHMVCLFAEDTDVATLNQYLGQLMDSNSGRLGSEPTHPSSLGCEEIAKKILHEQNGFWYAAHMVNDNGLLRLSGRGDNYVHLWKKDDLVIAAQIPNTVESLPANYQSIIRNQDPNYRRGKPIAIINAKDVAQSQYIFEASASCFIKMTAPTFGAFRDAFYDPASRIRLHSEMPNTSHSVIKSIQWEGAGFFSNAGMCFSKNLNAIIGGRGTGKSTLIESIRYVLDLDCRGSDTKMLDALRKSNLSNSQITLKVVSKAQHGQTYTVSRRSGEHPIVKNEEGEISHLTPRNLLPDIELLGQNAIAEIARDESAKLALIHNFLPDSNELDQKIDEIKNRLATNRDKLIRATAELEHLDATVSQESLLKERAGLFATLGIEKKLTSVTLLEKEEATRNKIQEQFDLVKHWLDQYADVFNLDFLQGVSVNDLPNREAIVRARAILEELKTAVDKLVGDAEVKRQSASTKYDAVKATWNKASGKIKDDLNQAIAQLPEYGGKTGAQLGREYQDIVKKLTSIAQQKDAHSKQKDLVQAIKQERSGLLEEYRRIAFARFDAMNDTAKSLNQGDLKGKINIKLVRCGNRESVKEFFLGMPGIGRSGIGWLDGEDVEVDLVQMAKCIEEKNAEALTNHYRSLSKSVASKMVDMSLEYRLRLEEIELNDLAQIELNVSRGAGDVQYVLLDNLSTGQKCTAILNLLLLSKGDPLIIDQPEDNLDNAFIAERIVADIRKLKTNRQFLFSTHNANIPVFGDAELIAVLECDQTGKKGTISCQGAIDKHPIRQHAADILEGGEAAFNLRKQKYGF